MTNNQQVRVIIVGAAGRDFHDFNVYWRNDPRYRVVAFTAAQIPDMEFLEKPVSMRQLLNDLEAHFGSSSAQGEL